MGLRHAVLPKWGIQPHPESILTSSVMQIICNFRDTALRHTGRAAAAPSGVGRLAQRHERKVHARKVDCNASAEAAFLKLFSSSRNAFWLVSQSGRKDMSRFTFMGCPPDDAVLTFRLSGDVSLEAGQQYLAGYDRRFCNSGTHRFLSIYLG